MQQLSIENGIVWSKWVMDAYKDYEIQHVMDEIKHVNEAFATELGVFPHLENWHPGRLDDLKYQWIYIGGQKTKQTTLCVDFSGLEYMIASFMYQYNYIEMKTLYSNSVHSSYQIAVAVGKNYQIWAEILKELLQALAQNIPLTAPRDLHFISKKVFFMDYGYFKLLLGLKYRNDNVDEADVFLKKYYMNEITLSKYGGFKKSNGLDENTNKYMYKR